MPASVAGIYENTSQVATEQISGRFCLFLEIFDCTHTDDDILF